MARPSPPLCLVPHLSCWERQAEGVNQRAQRGEARLDCLAMRERDQMEPGQEETGTDVGLEEQPQIVEVRLPPRPRIPGGMGVKRRGRRRRCSSMGHRSDVPELAEGGPL